MWKQIAAKVIENKHVVGFEAMRRVAMEVNAVVNEQNRTGGFSPLSGYWGADHVTQQVSKEMTRQLDS